MDYETFLRRVPKVDLHGHLMGSMRATTWGDLARKHDVAVPGDPVDIFSRINSKPPAGNLYQKTRIPIATQPGLDEPDPSYSLFQVSDWVAPTLRDRDDFARVAFEILEDATASNIRHQELFFEASDYTRRGIPYTTVVDGLIDGARAAEERFGITCRFIAGLNRAESHSLAEETVRTMLANPREQVVGIGLDNFELAGPPEQFAEAYRLAREGGLHRTAHTSEHDPSARNTVTCLDVLQCERLDHGYFVLEDDAVVARCRDEGVVFTCIFTTSRRAWRPFRRLSIRAMVNAGLRVTLADDDPGMFPTSLANEYVIAGLEQGYGLDQVRQFVLNGVDACWLEPADKERLRTAITTEMDALAAQVR